MYLSDMSTQNIVAFYDFVRHIYKLAVILAGSTFKVKNLPNDCSNHILELHLFKIYKKC